MADPMRFGYVMERSFRSIHILCINPEHLRDRLPLAWDEGQSQIELDEFPLDCKRARDGLAQLRQELSRVTETYFAKEFGFARASVQRRHGQTLQRLAEIMLDVHDDLERHDETRNLKGSK